MKIAAFDKTNGDANGVAHPITRFLGILPTMQFYNPDRRSDFVYGTAIHELAHYAHSGFDKVGYYLGQMP